MNNEIKRYLELPAQFEIEESTIKEYLNKNKRNLEDKTWVWHNVDRLKIPS